MKLTEITPIEEKPKLERLPSIDALRGIVMIVMVLDHVRDFFSNANFNPTDLAYTNYFMFFTRWITHYCAPIFVFLAGISAFLYRNQFKGKIETRVFLFTRGIWLMVLELTFVRFAWFFNFDYSLTLFVVIWAIGASMVLLSFILYTSRETVAVIGVFIIIAHNILDDFKAEQFGDFSWLFKFLHESGAITLSNGWTLVVGYPILPWLGIICAGYGFGMLYLLHAKRRKLIFYILGSVVILLFVVIRNINMYGDPHPWHSQEKEYFTILSFLNLTKYPPSMLYTFMTLGPAIVLLAVLENAKGIITNIFITIGKVPLFFYLLHILLIHSLAVVTAFLMGADIGFLFNNTPPWTTDRSFGFDLPIIYLVWILVVALLYPLCIWYMNFKKTHKEWWLLSYL